MCNDYITNISVGLIEFVISKRVIDPALDLFIFLCLVMSLCLI